MLLYYANIIRSVRLHAAAYGNSDVRWPVQGQSIHQVAVPGIARLKTYAPAALRSDCGVTPFPSGWNKHYYVGRQSDNELRGPAEVRGSRHQSQNHRASSTSHHSPASSRCQAHSTLPNARTARSARPKPDRGHGLALGRRSPRVRRISIERRGGGQAQEGKGEGMLG